MLLRSHGWQEDSASGSASKVNSQEAVYVAKLTKYLTQNGYGSSDLSRLSTVSEASRLVCVGVCSYRKTDRLVILTPYVGQLLRIRDELKKLGLGDVKVTAVDNFQGGRQRSARLGCYAAACTCVEVLLFGALSEEADVIVLSLVRSKKLGFVGIENRVVVALSRAKHGMYVVGNLTFLMSQSPLWAHICALAEERGQMQRYLELRCSKHPDTSVKAATAADFNKVPLGGWCVMVL
jgi:superfamily I DNA and/or RNA helicase